MVYTYLELQIHRQNHLMVFTSLLRGVLSLRQHDPWRHNNSLSSSFSSLGRMAWTSWRILMGCDDIGVLKFRPFLRGLGWDCVKDGHAQLFGCRGGVGNPRKQRASLFLCWGPGILVLWIRRPSCSWSHTSSAYQERA